MLIDYRRWINVASFNGSNNEVGADLAEMALSQSHQKTGEPATDVADLLCDLMHFADRAGISFDDALARACSSYADDIADDARAESDTRRF